MKKIGIIGAGSWATAIAKILTDNGHKINWWLRNPRHIEAFKKKKHNPHYLESITFPMRQLQLSSRLEEVVQASELLICVIPSAFITEPFETLKKSDPRLLENKKVLSAIKGILPNQGILFNEYLAQQFRLPATAYATILGPCHAEEVALERLSYLTFSSEDLSFARALSRLFKTPYIITRAGSDILGTQYAAILKNIYALGAGIAHGLRYGDNFLSVYNANAQREMSIFLNKLYDYYHISKRYNHQDSVYLGDLLVTCYSPYSRNREFGALLGKGYSVRSAQVEMNMTAEGYTTSKSIHEFNRKIKAPIPVLDLIYEIIWKGTDPAKGFKKIEKKLV